MSELSNLKHVRRGESGFTILQMVITIAIVVVVISFGVIAVKRAQNDMALSGALRQFSGYLEKGRVEAVRRHTSVTVITIDSDSSYTVTLDSNYDGTLSASETRSITLPTGATFSTTNITFPATVTYTAQGRSSFTNITGSTITISNTYGTTTSLTMTGGGDVTLDSTVTGPAASTNLVPTTTVSNTSNIKSMQ